VGWWKQAIFELNMSNFCQYLETVLEICSKLLLITT